MRTRMYGGVRRRGLAAPSYSIGARKILGNDFYLIGFSGRSLNGLDAQIVLVAKP